MQSHASPTRVAVAQATSVFFDKQASLEKACRFLAEAGKKGVQLLAFGESWLPGYPFFVDAAPDARWWAVAARYAENAIAIPGDETQALCLAAAAAGCDVVIGVAERDVAGGTVW